MIPSPRGFFLAGLLLLWGTASAIPIPPSTLDFGYGWSVDYQSAKLQKNVALGLAWEVTKTIGTFEVCLRPKSKRLVTVTLPDGKVERLPCPTVH